MKRRVVAAGIVAGLVLALAGGAAAGFDWGVTRDHIMASKSQPLFGVGTPLASSSTLQITKSQAQADPTSLVSLADGLHANVVSTQGGKSPDQISLWPNSVHPTDLIECNEAGTAHPGLERINIQTGVATTIVTGLRFCDPTRRTPWGSIVFGEENGGGADGGRMYELIDPLHTSGVTLDRATGVFSGGTGASNLTALPALGRASFEGVGILSSGVTYLDYDDDVIGPKKGNTGDAYLKFVPDHLWTGGSPITSLSQSPYASGTVYGFRAQNGHSYGQGREFGQGAWIELSSAPDADLESLAVAAKLTGYYRPEDADLDQGALSHGLVRLCGPDTGDESAHLYGEVTCITDGSPAQAASNTATPEAQPFEIGGTSQGINMPDNIAYQPGRGNWVLHEDAKTTFESDHNNDLWDCLPDGQDQDLLTDGCIRIATANDLTAEWTGGIFDASGKHFYVSVQHNISGNATILDITGWS